MEIKIDKRDFDKFWAEAFDENANNSMVNLFNDWKKELAKELMRLIIAWSPVKTGRFVNSWNVSPNVPVARNLPAGDYGGQRPTMQRFLQTINHTKFKDNIYIVNGLHYAMDLVRGSSRQAPAGWIDMAVISALGSSLNKVFK